MQIVPVLDLSKGLVVHAKKGIRRHYRPIQSSLCPTAYPVGVVQNFMELFDFHTLYIADLDAIVLQGHNADVVQGICVEYPELEIWLDTGPSLISHYLDNPITPSLRIILSTESLHSASILISLRNAYRDHRFVLSLDYKSNSILGSQEIMQERDSWPSDIVVLNLDHVGTCSGVNFPAIPNQQTLFAMHKIYYGGGIRNYADLLQLKNLGAAGALLSTALHEKTVTKTELQLFNR